MATRTPYDPPDVPVADPPIPARRLTRGQKILLLLFLINAAAGAFFILGAFVLGLAQSFVLAAAGLLLPAFGFAAAGLMVRYPVIGLALGIVFYALQTISYFSPEGNWGIRSGLHLSFSVRLGNGGLVVNVLAIVLSLAHVVAALDCHTRSGMCQ